MFASVFFLVILCELCSAYIYNLNESEYHRMPRLFHLDPYEPCLYSNNGTGIYCYVKFDLVTDQPNELYDMIREYSAKTEIHFNHSRLTYGICLTKTCLKFYQRNKTEVPGVILEACLNETFWKSHKLKTLVSKDITCDDADKKIDFDVLDICVTIVIGFLLVLNIIGSLQEVYFGNKNDKKGILYVSYELHRIIAGPTEMYLSMLCQVRLGLVKLGLGAPSRTAAMTGGSLEGIFMYSMGFTITYTYIRCFGTILVMLIHSMLPITVASDNPQFLEQKLMTNRITQTFINAPLMVQSFFVVSSFLLAFNLQIFAEKHKTNWLFMLKVIFYRFWRLVPVLFTVMGLYSIWGRHFGSGPLWQDMVQREVEDCRRDWWLSLLFINNYVDYSYCMLHTWYLAADTQLFYVGLLVFCLTSGRWRKWRKIVLGLLFFDGVLMSAAHTYYQDLDAILITSPEAGRNLFIKDATFNHTYKRGHTNLASYIMGFSLGLLIYHWQTRPTQPTLTNAVTNAGYKINTGFKLRLLFWISLPSMLVLLYVCGVFYMDAPRASLYIRTLCSALFKPLWSTSLVVFIMGLVFKFDDFIHGICEWQLWAVPSRLSYCMYVIHVVVIKLLTGTRTTLMHLERINIWETFTSVYCLSFLAAVPLHLLIEAPVNQLLKIGLSGDTAKDGMTSNGIKDKDSQKNGGLEEEYNGFHNKLD